MKANEGFDFSDPKVRQFLKSLSNDEFRIVSCLIRSYGKVVSKEDLVYFTWTESTFQRIDQLRVCVNHIRTKIKETCIKLEVKTVPGVGYLML